MKTNGSHGAEPSGEWRQIVAEIVREHEDIEGAVLPILHEVQHRLGHISEEALEAIAEGLHPYGMITFDQSLAGLVKQRFCTYEEALKHTTSPSDFALLFRGVSGSAERGWAGPEKGTSNDDFEIEH